MWLALLQALLEHTQTPPTSKQALQVYWDVNISGDKCSLQSLQDQVRHCRIRLTCCSKKKGEKPKQFKLHIMLSAQLQTAQITWNSQVVGTVHQAVCESLHAVGGKFKPGGPPRGGLERETEKLFGKIGVQKGPTEMAVDRDEEASQF
ncbi:unnamed protein product [Prorocentrum cordatum]|uniref:Uncharacterized protein n=1 Tax=Prorocentrum cordatum TaxID=2364126 RepID=A0ABN9U952_9DINO|nr:unnamed protein product [Polarella glacialis]